MKRLSLLLALAALPAKAETDPASIELSPVMTMIVQRGFEPAAHQLGSILERFGDGEQLDLGLMSEIADGQRTQNRSEKVANYLAADFDWDGIVTRAELERFFAGQDQSFVDGYLRDGDLDGDEQITVDEMLADAKLDHPDDAEPINGLLKEMVGWDLNGDGILHFEEILAVIEANA